MPAPLAPLTQLWQKRHLPPLSGRWAVGVGGRAFAIAGLAAENPGPMLVVVPGEKEAEELYDDLSLFVDRVEFMPAWETLPFEHISPNLATMARRARARHLLTKSKQPLVVASVRAAIQRLSPSAPDPIRLSTGDTLDPIKLIRALSKFGYETTDRVEARGEIASRGGIVDIFPAAGDRPVRVDFWGETLEEIRNFSVGTQRSTDPRSEVWVHPAREFRPDQQVQEMAERLIRTEPWAAATWERLSQAQVFAGMESWMPWLAPPESLFHLAAHQRIPVVLVEPTRTHTRAQDLIDEEDDLAQALAPTWGHGSPQAGEHPLLFLDPTEILAQIDRLDMPSVPPSESDPVLPLRAFTATPGKPESIAEALGQLSSAGTTVVVAMDGVTAADRVATFLLDAEYSLPRSEELSTVSSAIISRGIHHGFVLDRPAVAVVGEAEIAGRRRAHRRVGPPTARHPDRIFQDLSSGDYVVHNRHGIGRFEGLETRTTFGVEKDYLVVGYAAGDRLLVPTDQLASIKRYTGGESPRVSRMGGADWERTKDRVREAVSVIAEQVVALHRARATATGNQYPPDSPWQREVEGMFGYEETPDQLSAINDVKADMESDRPMDRLVFGDVGFGKTEVALRAAFKAAETGKQVAVLCPTTLLAQQHHQVFSERFASYPLRVEMLSRFLTPKQTRQVIAGIALGEVDVVIGTHRLLSEDIKWHNLGLLVVDEEHRFGVTAKDKIKTVSVGVDVLTLTATPIPRTLEMALTGIRPVSHIRTPPEDRHPILTYAGPFDEQTVSAAIRRELLRDGQVFYVHNRVQSIDQAVERLKELVPDARYAVAHGQMSEGALEQIMLDFWNGDYNVLVATTIIESGLDLPKVNTLIVERADLLGLAQLYQLRGRVGRSNLRAYAYLFHPPDLVLTEETHRRLEAIGESADLGSGFRLAMRDLEIRGAGSILGEVQSGHIATVGFDMYAELVAEAVDELEGTEPTQPEDDRPEIRIELNVDAHLPTSYISEQTLRLEAYRRLAEARTLEQVEDVFREWEDRFGSLPKPAKNLIDVARLRVLASQAGLTEIVQLRKEIRLSPVRLLASQEIRLQRLLPEAVFRGGEEALFIPIPKPPLLANLLNFLALLWPSETSDTSNEQLEANAPAARRTG